MRVNNLIIIGNVMKQYFKVLTWTESIKLSWNGTTGLHNLSRFYFDVLTLSLKWQFYNICIRRRSPCRIYSMKLLWRFILPPNLSTMSHTDTLLNRGGIFKLLCSPEIDSASLCILAGRYENPIPTWFLAPIDCLKIPAQKLIVL